MRDWEADQERERREIETFRRIHQLTKRGYRIDWAIRNVEDAIWFEHPSRRHRLILYPDGKIVSLDKSVTLDASPKSDPDRIYNNAPNDAQLFDRWLITVPLPSWRERTRADREKYIWQPGCFVVFFLASLAIGKVVEMIWKSVTGT